MESLACSYFTDMMADVGINKEKVLRIAEMYLDEFNRSIETIKALPAPINLVLGRFRRIASAAVCLIHPLPGHMNSSAADVTDLRKYKGPEVAEATVRNLLTCKEVKRGDVMVPNPWTKLHDELITKGQFTLSHLDELRNLEAKLEKLESENPGLGCSMEELDILVTNLPPLHKGMREGMCKKAMELLKNQLLGMAKSLLNIRNEEDLSQHNKGHHFVSLIQKGLGSFETAAGVPKMIRDLSTWSRQFGKLLSKCEMLQVAENYPEDPHVEPDSFPKLKALDFFVQAAFACGKEILSKTFKEEGGGDVLAKTLGWNFMIIEKAAKVRWDNIGEG